MSDLISAAIAKLQRLVPRHTGRALSFVVGYLFSSATYADAARPGGSESALQSEADYRVIAARCGSPMFEKQFFKQSNAAVVAGLVVSNRDAATVEKAVEARRRNPLQLVSTRADCAEKMTTLKAVQQQRAQALRSVPRR
jgi:hypothetical protein